MAGGVIAPAADSPRSAQYNGKITPYVVIVAIVAASGGLLFGYDIGVTGGVTAMTPFLEKFFPQVLAQNGPSSSPYCTYDNQNLQLFTSSLFLAGMVAGIFASWTTRRGGRKLTMLLGGICFLIGAGLTAGAQALAMLVIGRIMLGFGVGFANQSVPLYLSEIAPAHTRGMLNIMFQLATTIGILSAQLINYGTEKIEAGWGWRLSLGLAAVPAALLTIGGLVLPDTPNSLIDRGHKKEGRRVLEKVRGTKDVDAEFNDICDAAATAALVKHPFRNIIQRRYRPQLVLAVLIPLFQQFTGINAIMFYAPQLFGSLGSSSSTALIQTLIIGAVNVVATFVAIWVVDRLGRRILFLEGGSQMLVAEITMGIVLGVEFSKYGETLPNAVVYGVIVVICVYVAGFAWSWGPLGWLVPTEIQPLETRSAGQSITVSTNFLFSFVIGQSFLSMLCTMEYGIFLFFAGWVAIMTVFVYFFVPETKGRGLEEVQSLFATHWFWKRMVGPVERESVEVAGAKVVDIDRTAAY